MDNSTPASAASGRRDEVPSRYRDAFERAAGGMALLAAGGQWQAANAAIARMLGRDAAALVGAHAHEVLFDPGAAERIRALTAAAGREDTDVAFDASDAHDPRRRWRATVSALPGGWLLQLREADAAPSRPARDEAEHREQDLLAFGLSHDLRAPLRSIAGFAARLDESASLDDEGRADLARIHAAAARAEALIDALLELSRAAHQPLRDEIVDIGLLGDWVASELRDADPAREAVVLVPEGLYARGDEHWIKSLLHKLLDNAWKFSADRERVEIRIEGEVDGDRLRLAVHDHGCGFDMRYADKLFLPFQRLHGADQGGGSGLGLAIATRIAERHGGRLWASSRPGEGSTFHIELPAAGGDAA